MQSKIGKESAICGGKHEAECKENNYENWLTMEPA